MDALAVRCPRQFQVPVFKQGAQFFAQANEFLDTPIQFREALADKLTNISARGATFVAYAQDSSQVRERKPHDECSLDEQHSLNRRGRVSPIPSRRSPDGR
jgi:hypothetical protein